MTPSRLAAVIYRFAFALTALAGIAVQLFWVSIPLGLGVVNFFSYFTILSNLFASIIFIISAVRIMQEREPSALDVALRGAAVVYMVFVGIVFITLLRDVPLGGLKPWINLVHHYIMPVAVLLDWIIWAPRRKLSWRPVFAWMVFPIVYVIYSLIRGPITGFYAYPFFNPAVQGGYGGVALYCFFMVIGFVLIAISVRAIGNARSKPAPPLRTR
ncbi:Pr6Pr family membrane protein [Humidisolicoccus flavus]|uniref:Pr6Pr family membrane protein n=1 Tax=Humidisolicoccus flavus TaxID=3111414 RepID=UPI003247E6CB